MTDPFASYIRPFRLIAIGISLLMLSASIGFAQLPLVWKSTFGNGGGGNDQGDFIRTTASGDILVAGIFEGQIDMDQGPSQTLLTSNGGTDVFIARYATNGSLIFAKNFGSGLDEHVSGFEVDSSGNFVIAGNFHQTMDCDLGSATSVLQSNGGTDMFLISYDINAILIQALSFGDAADDEINHMIRQGNMNILITGNCNGTIDFDPASAAGNVSLPQGGIFMAKFDPAFSNLWSYGFGSGSSESGQQLAVDSSGIIFLTGKFSNLLEIGNNPSKPIVQFGNPTFETVFMARFNSEGQILNGVTIANPNGEDIEVNASITNGLSEFYIAGSFSGTVDFSFSGNPLTASGNDNDAFVVRYDSLFNQLSAYTLLSTHNASINDIRCDVANNYFITGFFCDDATFGKGSGAQTFTAVGPQDLFIASFNSADSLLFVNVAGGNGASTSGTNLISTNSGTIYLTGSFSNEIDFDQSSGSLLLNSPVKLSFFIASYSSSGNIINSFKAEESSAGGFDQATKVHVTPLNHTYVAGKFSGTIEVTSQSGPIILNSSGGEEAVVFKYDETGNLIHAFKIGGTGNDRINAIISDSSGNIYIAGGFSGTVDFNPGAGVTNLVAAGGEDMFFAKYDDNGSLVWARKAGGSGSDGANGLTFDGGNNLIVTGYFSNTVDMNPAAPVNNLVSAGSADFFIASYNTSGVYVSAIRYGGSGHDSASDILYDATTGSFAVTGKFTGSVNFNPGGSAMNLTSSGGVTGSDAFFARYNSSGALIWVKQLGSAAISATINSMQLIQGVTSELLIAGFAQSRNGADGNLDLDPGIGSDNMSVQGNDGKDAFVARFVFGNSGNTGNYIWSGKFQSYYDEEITNIAVDRLSETWYAIGNFNGEIDLNPDAVFTSLYTPSGASDIFVIAFIGTSNQFNYAESFGGIANDAGTDMALDVNDRLRICGSFTGTADLAPGIFSSTSVSASGSADGFLIALGDLCEPVDYQGSSQTITICQGKNFTITAINGNQISFYDALSGGILLSSGSQFTTPVLQSTTTYFIGDDVCPLTPRTSVTVNVDVIPPVLVSASGPTTFCAGGNVQLTASTGSSYAYQWKKYGNLISGATDTVYAASGTGTYKVTATSSSGCSRNSGNTFVVVNPLPPANITATGNTSFCVGDSVKLEANSATGYSYQWKKYSNDIAGAVSQQYVAQAAGQYKVRITDANGCSRNSNSILISLLPSPPASIFAGGALSFCDGDSVLLRANSGIGISYQWRKGSSYIAGATSDEYYARATGNYKVTVTGANGCTKNSNVLSVTIVCREVHASEQNDLFTVYPNPGAGNFNIKLNDIPRSDFEYVVFDQRGAIITKGIINAGNFGSIALPHISSGVYLLSISGAEKNQNFRIVCIPDYQH
ncbi:MAG: T9SS type A sorting domain-containing protein [Bacteroidia bacterium]|nr:T9SS type A sorting domain-containing protein [Bacteroidia bacterium]